mgnify:CR=1 FL=1|tara:strand:- start:112 stop:348 length:237 start_codon:yes stop_codon:yes gene_type:complete
MKLRKLIKLLYDDKTIPIDIVDFLNDDYESNSLGYVSYGEIDLIHYIRANLKHFKEINNKTYMINANKLKEIESIINK